MNLKELREKIAKILYEYADGVSEAVDPTPYIDQILSIEIGGEVWVEECPICKHGIGEQLYVKQEDKVICPCQGTNKLTRPRLLRDCVKEER